MPGAVVGGHELEQFAVAPNQEMGRDFGASNQLEVGVGVPVQLVGEQALDLVTTIVAGGQADGMNQGQVDRGAWRARAKVGRVDAAGLGAPAIWPGVVRHWCAHSASTSGSKRSPST